MSQSKKVFFCASFLFHFLLLLQCQIHSIWMRKEKDLFVRRVNWGVGYHRRRVWNRIGCEPDFSEREKGERFINVSFIVHNRPVFQQQASEMTIKVDYIKRKRKFFKFAYCAETWWFTEGAIPAMEPITADDLISIRRRWCWENG